MTSHASPRPVCVLSSGRAGTSLVARVINLLGVDLGPEETMLGATHLNPKGYWEQDAIMQLNDAILAALGGSLYDPPRPEPGWERQPAMAPFRKRAEELVDAMFSDVRRWGFKDPRTVATLPLWRAVIGEMDYLICVRNAGEVVASLQFGKPDEDVNHLLGLWLFANCEALRQTSEARRLILFYEDWFAEPETVTRRIATFLHCSPEAVSPTAWNMINGLFDPDLRHHRDDRTNDERFALEVRALDTVVRLIALQEERGDRPAPQVKQLAESLDHLFEQRVGRERAAALGVARVEAENARLACALETHQRRVAAMEASASWRLTAPLRAAKQRARRS